MLRLAASFAIKISADETADDPNQNPLCYFRMRYFQSIKHFDGGMWLKSIEMSFILNDGRVNKPQMIIWIL